MTYQQHKFHIAGSNALKTEEVEYDVFIKPQFLSERNTTHIIDLTGIYDQVQTPRANQTYGATCTCFGMQAINALRHNRILGDLFTTRKRNRYRREDLIVFAKGFSVTGVAVFFLILFGA